MPWNNYQGFRVVNLKGSRESAKDWFKFMFH
jgi:hypothetical protein